MHRPRLSRVALASWVLATVLASCGDDGRTLGAASHPDAAISLTLADFSDGSWTLRVDRALRTGTPITTPTQTLSEQDYAPVAEKTEYAVVVSKNAQQISGGTPAWSGARAAGDAAHANFDLSAGTFAGGRFVVWAAEDGLQAELTLYGSGVPIVKSERGALIRITR